MSFLSIHITTSSLAEADKIARELVNARLAACVSILPGLRSIYRWEGRVETAHEHLLIVKTRADLFKDLEQKVKSLHSYACPCIIALPVEAGYQPYLDWLAKETQTPS